MKSTGPSAGRPPALRSRALRCLVLCALAACWAPVAAERADRDKPTNIESDRLQYDDAKKVTVFTGNVVLTKGTIVIRGDRLVLRQFEDGTQAAVATGKRASFRQKREGIDQFIHGLANEIDYDARAETLKLTGDALIKRLECEQAVDEITGGVIVYNARTETFTVDGKDPSGGGGRVRIVIQPRSESRAPDPRAGGASAPGGSGAVRCPTGDATTLKPAARLAPQRPSAAAAR